MSLCRCYDQIQLLALDIKVHAIRGVRWRLSAVTMPVTAPLGSPQVRWFDDRRKGRIVEASWDVPEGWDAEDVALQLTIEATE